MRVKLDDTLYNIDLKKLIQFYKLLYSMARTDGIHLPNGQNFHLGDNLLIRTALKAAMTPVIIPFIKDLYKSNGIDLPAAPKHADLIDYAVGALLDFCIISQEKLDVSFTSETGENCSRSIITVSASWREEEAATTNEKPTGLLTSPDT